MNWESWIVSGFLATLGLTTVAVGSQGLHLTRMNVPYLLGTIMTQERERAHLYGFLAHLVNGWVFSFFYIYIFEVRHIAEGTNFAPTA